MNRYLGPDSGLRTVFSLEFISLDVYNSPPGLHSLLLTI